MIPLGFGVLFLKFIEQFKEGDPQGLKPWWLFAISGTTEEAAEDGKRPVETFHSGDDVFPKTGREKVLLGWGSEACH